MNTRDRIAIGVFLLIFVPNLKRFKGASTLIHYKEGGIKIGEASKT
jgi:hypothetical protein